MSLYTQTVEGLKQYCRESGITGYSGKSKADLIQYIIASTKTAAAATVAKKAISAPPATAKQAPAVVKSKPVVSKPAVSKPVKGALSTSETVEVLKAHCRDNGITGYSGKKKDDLIIHMAANGVVFDGKEADVPKVAATRAAQAAVKRVAPVAAAGSFSISTATFDMLRNHCRVNGITGYSGKKKEDLIEYMKSLGVV
jgi:hypothetical protein